MQHILSAKLKSLITNIEKLFYFIKPQDNPYYHHQNLKRTDIRYFAGGGRKYPVSSGLSKDKRDQQQHTPHSWHHRGYCTVAAYMHCHWGCFVETEEEKVYQEASVF